MVRLRILLQGIWLGIGLDSDRELHLLGQTSKYITTAVVLGPIA